MSVHPTAYVHPDAKVGRFTDIGPFTEVGPYAVIGEGSWLVGCTVEGTIGERTKVWRYAHVMRGAVIGNDCQVCNGAIVLTDAVVGDRTDIQLWSGVARHAIVGNDVFIAPNVVFCNSKHPYRGQDHADLQRIIVQDGASIGANSSLMAGIVIGNGAVVGAGSVVTKSVPNNAVVYGNPAIPRFPSTYRSGCI